MSRTIKRDNDNNNSSNSSEKANDRDITNDNDRDKKKRKREDKEADNTEKATTLDVETIDLTESVKKKIHVNEGHIQIFVKTLTSKTLCQANNGQEHPSSPSKFRPL